MLIMSWSGMSQGVGAHGKSRATPRALGNVGSYDIKVSIALAFGLFWVLLYMVFGLGCCSNHNNVSVLSSCWVSVLGHFQHFWHLCVNVTSYFCAMYGAV